tara:strand:- start:682 stop:873 length:192 start_codon:yes stop_codon:yes gene_type:complete
VHGRSSSWRTKDDFSSSVPNLFTNFSPYNSRVDWVSRARFGWHFLSCCFFQAAQLLERAVAVN